MKIKDLVKDNSVKFVKYRRGFLYYKITDLKQTALQGKDITYFFTVPTADVGTATLLSEHKAITFMRWIRIAVEKNRLLRLI